MNRRDVLRLVPAALVAPIVAIPALKKGLIMTGKRVEMTPEQMTAFDRINYRRLALELRKRLHYATEPEITVGYYRAYYVVAQEMRVKIRAMWQVLREAVSKGVIDNYVVESAPTTIGGWGPKWTIYLEKNGHREFVVTIYIPKQLEYVMEGPGKEQTPLLGARTATYDGRDAG